MDCMYFQGFQGYASIVDSFYLLNVFILRTI